MVYCYDAGGGVWRCFCAFSTIPVPHTYTVTAEFDLGGKTNINSASNQICLTAGGGTTDFYKAYNTTALFNTGTYSNAAANSNIVKSITHDSGAQGPEAANGTYTVRAQGYRIDVRLVGGGGGGGGPGVFSWGDYRCGGGGGGGGSAGTTSVGNISVTPGQTFPCTSGGGGGGGSTEQNGGGGGESNFTVGGTVYRAYGGGGGGFSWQGGAGGGAGGYSNGSGSNGSNGSQGEGYHGDDGMDQGGAGGGSPWGGYGAGGTGGQAREYSGGLNYQGSGASGGNGCCLVYYYQNLYYTSVTWTSPGDSISGVAIAGRSIIDWDQTLNGGSITVECSVDGTNWYAQTKGGQIVINGTAIADGYNCAGKTLRVRVTLAGSTTAAPEISNLRLTVDAKAYMNTGVWTSPAGVQVLAAPVSANSITWNPASQPSGVTLTVEARVTGKDWDSGWQTITRGGSVTGLNGRPAGAFTLWLRVSFATNVAFHDTPTITDITWSIS